MINFGVLQPTVPDHKVQVVQTGGGGGDDLMGRLSGLLGGLGDLKKAFGPNPVSQANNAIAHSLGGASPQQVAGSILPSLVPEQQNPGTALNRYQNSLSGRPDPMQTQQQTALGAIKNPFAVSPNVPGQGGTLDQNSILNHTMQSIANVESGGAKDPYSLISKPTGKGDHSYGKYQITGANIPSWTKAATGKALTPTQFLASPEVQEATAKHMMGGYLKQYGNPNDVASAWFTGRPVSKAGLSVKDSYGTTNGDYQKKFTEHYNKLSNPNSKQTPLMSVSKTNAFINQLPTPEARQNYISTLQSLPWMPDAHTAIAPQFAEKLPNVIQELKQRGFDPVIASGSRSQAEQDELVRKGNSHTHKSNHLTGQAVDIVDKRYQWNEQKYKQQIDEFSQAMAEIAEKNGLESGTKWKKFGPNGDYAHIQLRQTK